MFSGRLVRMRSVTRPMDIQTKMKRNVLLSHQRHALPFLVPYHRHLELKICPLRIPFRRLGELDHIWPRLPSTDADHEMSVVLYQYTGK